MNEIKTIRQRVFKHWVTSLIGLVLMIGGVVLYFLKKKYPDLDFSIPELLTIEAFGVLLLWVKESLLMEFCKKILGIKTKRNAADKDT